MQRRREVSTGPHRTMDPLTGVLLIIGFSAALATTACGPDAPAAESTTSTAATPGSGAIGNLPRGSEPAELDPADFTTTIDNPYWPMAPG